MNQIAKIIEREVLNWSGVTLEPHRFGDIEFCVNNHEIGHLHGDYLAFLAFPVRDRQELVAQGRRAVADHIYPKSGWVSYYIHDVEDVLSVVALFRRNYERLSRLPSSKPDTQLFKLIYTKAIA